MVDFNKLRTKKKKAKSIEPKEIFRSLPKPPGINDLYNSQAEVLQAWFESREERDVVVKLHTGGGKTLVGLLMAQSTLNETKEPVLYLTPTVQLVNQTFEKAKALGLHVVRYKKGQPLDEDFINANAIMIGTYKALFNGRSKFGLRGDPQPQTVCALILDDAHSAFSVIRESFTLEIKVAEDKNLYKDMVALFRYAFKGIDKAGMLDEIVSGSEFSVLEVPYWAWNEKLDVVGEKLRTHTEKYGFVWPLLRDQLHLCHGLINNRSFIITPILPLVNTFPTFYDAPRRIYMSATIADDSDIIRTFDAEPDLVKKSLTSRSLAGVSERMILMPELMPFEFDIKESIKEIIQKISEKNLGVIILVPSDKNAIEWQEIGVVAKGSSEVEKLIEDLQEGKTSQAIVFSNRYDGIDLPGDSCRLLVMAGLPIGTSSYELFRAGALYKSSSINRLLAQRIEQGIGRGARGAGDHCVVLLTGSNLAGWITKETNFGFLTNSTKTQFEIGEEISKEVVSIKDFEETIERSLERNQEWIQYHAETLAELIDEKGSDESLFILAKGERKAFNLWQDGYHQKAITKIEKVLDKIEQLDPQIQGWMEQFGARIANHWNNHERAEDLQRQAYAHNRNLLKPKTLPPYRLLSAPTEQTRAIVKQIGDYRLRQGFLQNFEEVVSFLNKNSSSNQFEQALADFAVMIGFSSERKDVNGLGPDVLWLLPQKVGFVIEAKSRKKEKNALTKEEHGQLLVAAEWFSKNYKDFECIRISVHPKNQATTAAVAGASHALTYEKLTILITEARTLLSTLCGSQLENENLITECENLLQNSRIRPECFVENFLLPFEETEK